MSAVRAIEGPLCLDCNYPLRGLESSNCPECGRAFHHDDPTTVNTGRAMSCWTRWWLKPTGRWVNLLALVAGGLLIAAYWPRQRRSLFSYGYWSGADVWVPEWTGNYHEWFYFDDFAVWSWVWLLVMWVIFAAGRWGVATWKRQPRRSLLLDRRRRRCACIVFLVSVTVAGFHIRTCPHATYYDFWDFGGVARGRPCGYYALRPVHLGGSWYFYRVG